MGETDRPAAVSPLERTRDVEADPGAEALGKASSHAARSGFAIRIARQAQLVGHSGVA